MPLDALQIMQGYRARDLADQAAQQHMDMVPQEFAMKQQAQKALADLQGQQMMQKVQQGRQLAAYQAATLASKDMDRASRERTAAEKVKALTTIAGDKASAAAAKTAQTEDPLNLQNAPGYSPDLTGDELLKVLPPTVAREVQARANGDRLPPSAFALKNPALGQTMGLVQQYDPSYTDARYKIKQDYFGTGKNSTPVANLNQAILHMGTLMDLNAALGNRDTQGINKTVNFVKNYFGDPAINNAGLAQKAVSDELMRVFRGTGAASEKEAADFEKRLLSTQGSPEEQIGAVRTGAELLKGRLSTMEDQFATGMGHERFRKSLLMPAARAAWDKINSSAPPIASSTGSSPAWDDTREKRYQELLKKRGSQ